MLFQLQESNGKLRPMSLVENAIAESPHFGKEVVGNDPSQDLIKFVREEMEKSGENEVKFFQLMQNSGPNACFTSHQQCSAAASIC